MRIGHCRSRGSTPCHRKVERTGRSHGLSIRQRRRQTPLCARSCRREAPLNEGRMFRGHLNVSRCGQIAAFVSTSMLTSGTLPLRAQFGIPAVDSADVAREHGPERWRR